MTMFQAIGVLLSLIAIFGLINQREIKLRGQFPHSPPDTDHVRFTGQP